jgi:hypothetical protein
MSILISREGGFTAKGLGCISALSPGDVTLDGDPPREDQMKKWSRHFGLAAALAMISSVTFAHHGSAVSYNLSKMMTMEGTVTEFQWRNPHVYILYDAKDDKGDAVNWGAETHSPIVCENEDGWTKSTLKPGDKITISVFPANIGTNRGLLAKIVFNGKVILDDTSRGRQAGQ